MGTFKTCEQFQAEIGQALEILMDVQREAAFGGFGGTDVEAVALAEAIQQAGFARYRFAQNAEAERRANTIA